MTAPSPTSSNRVRWLWAFALAALIVFASGNNPQPPVPTFIGFDKVAHFGVFGLLATLLLRTHGVWRRPGWRAAIAIGVVSIFGLTDEWHQSFTPGRSVELGDWIADTTGAALAVALYLRWPWYRRLLETPLRLRRRQRTAQDCAEATKSRADLLASR